VPAQNSNAPQQEQHVVASPNPSIDDSKTPATANPKKVEVKPVQPAQSATHAPLKTTTRPKSRSKHTRTKPHAD
jgi:hypothetical protein